MVQIYVDYEVLQRDMVHKESLCYALNELEKQGKCRIYVLSPSGIDIVPQTYPFAHELIAEGFGYISNLPLITKDITYISCNSDNLCKWYELNGKPILSAIHPMKEKDFYFNRFSVNSDNMSDILNKLKKYIHI